MKKHFISLIIISVTVLVVGDSYAQRSKKRSTVADVLAKYQEKDRGAGVKFDKFTRLIPESSKPRGNVVRNTRSIKPPSSNKFFISGNEKESQLERILDEQIDELYILSQKFRKSPERGEIWLRLGELYVEKAKMVGMRIQDDFDRKIQKWEGTGKKGPAPKVDITAPHVYNKKAIQLYEWYEKDFSKSKKLDQAYFFLGYNFVEIGKFKKGTSFYTKLTKQFPKSMYVTESYFALAEYHFENNDWKKAIENYKAVIKDEDSRIYGFALYKLAWSYYRSGLPAVAIANLEKVIEISKNSSEEGDGKQLNKIRLGEEAFNDLILFYPEAKSYQTAADYFEQLGGSSKLYTSLEKLAYHYSDKGQREAARYIFGQLIEMRPNAAKNFDYQYQVVMNYWAGGSRQIFRQEFFDWITKYNADSDWASSNSKEVQRSYDLRESTLRSYILQEHKALQKSRNPTGQKLTKNLYELYIKEFSNSKNVAEMRFFYGELLYDMNEFDLSSEQYKWVIQNAPDSKYYSSSILNEILALEKSLPDEKDIAKIRGESLDPFEMNKEEKAFVIAGENYTQKFPKAEKAADIKFRVGRIYYSHNYFDQALVVFRAVLKEHPKTPFAKYSANLILDIFNLRKDYQGLTKAGEELLNDPTLKSGDVTADVKNVVERARFKEGQDLEGEKKYLEAAKAFESFSRNYATSPLAGIAKFNSGINYERAGDLKKATALYVGFLAFPQKGNEKQKKEARRLIGRNFERTGQLEKAADEFEKFAKENPNDPLTPDLYYNSAVIWAGFKNYSKAIRNYELFYNASKKASKVDAIYVIGEIYQKQGKLATANKYFERYINDNPRDLSFVIKATYNIATNSEKMNQKSNSEDWFKKVLFLRKKAKGDVGLREAAEAEFKLTLGTWKDMKAIGIPQNPQGQGEAVQKKLALINQLNQQLAKVIKYDVGEWIVASLYTAGDSYEHLTNAIERAPRPKGLTPEQTKQYEDEVAKISTPLRAQAIENYKSAIDRGRKLDTYNSYFTDAMNGLNRVNKVSNTDEEVFTEYMPSKVEL